MKAENAGRRVAANQAGRIFTFTTIADVLPETGRGSWSDPGHSGIYLEGHKNRATWYIRHNVDGKRLKDKLGVWPLMDHSDAVEAARTRLQAVAIAKQAGGDPVADRAKKRKVIEQRRASITLNAAIDQYRADRSDLRSIDHAVSTMKKTFETLLAKRLSDIDQHDLIAVLETKRRTAPAMADISLRYARPLFRWIRETGRGDALLQDIKARQSRQRDRVLKPFELRLIIAALQEMADTPSMIALTLLATGSRLNEVAAMTLAEIGRGDQLWTLPSDRSKNGREFLIPLNDIAMTSIEQGIHNSDSDLVFPGKLGTPFSGWSRYKKRLDDRCGVKDWVFHDFRRAFATQMVDDGFDPVTIDKCLNHAASGTQSGVMRVYQRSAMLDQRRAAMNAWSDKLQSLMAK